MKTKLQVLARMAHLRTIMLNIATKRERGVHDMADVGTALRIAVEIQVLEWVLKGEDQ